MKNWRERYFKNYMVGLAFSILFHIIIVFFLNLMPPMPEPQLHHNEFINPYSIQLTTVNLEDINSGGGSFGDGTNRQAIGYSSSKALAGIPIPSPDQLNIDFGKITNLIESNDTAMQSGSGLGTGSGTGIGSGSGSGVGDGSGWGVGFKSLPFVPRQILEVLPQNVDGAKGEIVLLLKISVDGSVKEHKVVYDTSEEKFCLKNAVEAAYKSRWEKIKIEENRVEYWVEKRYSFN